MVERDQVEAALVVLEPVWVQTIFDGLAVLGRGVGQRNGEVVLDSPCKRGDDFSRAGEVLHTGGGDADLMIETLQQGVAGSGDARADPGKRRLDGIEEWRSCQRLKETAAEVEGHAFVVSQIQRSLCDWVIGQPPIDRAIALLGGDGKTCLLQHLYIALNGAFGDAEFGAELLQGASVAPQEMDQP